MVNLDLLNRKIEYEGLKLQVISFRMGISRTTLWSRLTGQSEFTIDEIKDLCIILHLNEKERKEIFNINTERNNILQRV